MKDKDIKKAPIMDLFDFLINSEESNSILEAIRKERGEEKAIETKEEELTNRKSVMEKLNSDKKGETKKNS